MEKLPALRSDIQLIPALLQGRQVLAVQDRLGLSPQTGVLSADLATLLSLFDGDHSVRDLQVAMMRQQGNRLVMQSEVEQLIDQLDELYLLQTERYRREKLGLREEFSGMERRPAALAGSAYPADVESVKAMMQQIFASTKEGSMVSGPLRALVAPHIDIRAGQEVYAKAFAALRGSTARRVVILGTGHAIESGYFSLTQKDYETPFGRVKTDKQSVDLLREAGRDAIEPDDFAHRSEHSIEFQVLFLQYCLAQPFDAVPILVGSFGEQLHKVRNPRDIPGVGRFIETLSHLVNEETILVAGVDFSHVGPKFGHPHSASSYEAEFRDHDGRLLEALSRGNIEEFWAEGQRVGDRYHVCGFPVLACLLELLPETQGIVLGYDIWHEASTRSAVSFAAAALTESKEELT